MKNNRKISSILINSNYQGKFLVTFGSFGALFMGVFFYTIYFMMDQVRLLALGTGVVASSPIFGKLEQLEYNMYYIGGGFSLVVFTLFLVLGFRFTHKTAGVLYHFKTEFSKMEQSGELHELNLRDGDFFRDTELAFNNLVQSRKNK